MCKKQNFKALLCIFFYIIHVFNKNVDIKFSASLDFSTVPRNEYEWMNSLFAKSIYML
jgi:hypothetical protein